MEKNYPTRRDIPKHHWIHKRVYHYDVTCRSRLQRYLKHRCIWKVRPTALFWYVTWYIYMDNNVFFRPQQTYQTQGASRKWSRITNGSGVLLNLNDVPLYSTLKAFREATPNYIVAHGGTRSWDHYPPLQVLEEHGCVRIVTLVWHTRLSENNP